MGGPRVHRRLQARSRDFWGDLRRSQQVAAPLHPFAAEPRTPRSKKTYYIVKRDLLHCQKRPVCALHYHGICTGLSHVPTQKRKGQGALADDHTNVLLMCY